MVPDETPEEAIEADANFLASMERLTIDGDQLVGWRYGLPIYTAKIATR
jgi:hypothetical protein